MINAKELRIGNLVRDQITGTYLKVIELTEEDIITYVIDRNFFPLQNGWGIEPIPLTEEILLKCGYSESDLETGKILVVGESFDNIIGYTIRSLSPSLVIKTVHQFQNIYYALTNKELECLI